MNLDYLKLLWYNFQKHEAMTMSVLVGQPNKKKKQQQQQTTKTPVLKQ